MRAGYGRYDGYDGYDRYDRVRRVRGSWIPAISIRVYQPKRKLALDSAFLVPGRTRVVPGRTWSYLVCTCRTRHTCHGWRKLLGLGYRKRHRVPDRQLSSPLGRGRQCGGWRRERSAPAPRGEPSTVARRSGHGGWLSDCRGGEPVGGLACGAAAWRNRARDCRSCRVCLSRAAATRGLRCRGGRDRRGGRLWR